MDVAYEEESLLPIGAPRPEDAEEPLEAHHRPWPWRGARVFVAAAIVWTLCCLVIRPHCQAYYGSKKMKGAPAWRLAMMLPTALLVLPTLLLLAIKVDGRGLTLEEWGARWAKDWRASLTRVKPQTDFSWAFLGTFTAVFVADFFLVQMSWPLKGHHVVSLGLIYIASFLFPACHPYIITAAASLELGTAFSNIYYLASRSPAMRIPFALGMSASNAMGFYMLYRVNRSQSTRTRLILIPFTVASLCIILSREVEMVTVAVLNYSFSGQTDTHKAPHGAER